MNHVETATAAAPVVDKNELARQLREAAAIIERAVRPLQTESHECPSCTRRIYADFEQAMFYQRMSNHAQKLRRAARLLSAGEWGSNREERGGGG